MEITTKLFGTIDVDKVITFPNGIIGFPELKSWVLIDDDTAADSVLKWLQSLDEPAFALPCIDPLYVCPDYKPSVLYEQVKSIDDLQPEKFAILVTISIPKDITKMSVNLAGPIIINTESFKGTQVCVEGDDYSSRYPVYDCFKKED